MELGPESLEAVTTAVILPEEEGAPVPSLPTSLLMLDCGPPTQPLGLFLNLSKIRGSLR